MFQIVTYTPYCDSASAFAPSELYAVFNAIFRNSWRILLLKCSVASILVVMFVLLMIFSRQLFLSCLIPVTILVVGAIVSRIFKTLLAFMYRNDEIVFRELIAPKLFSYSAIMNFGTLAICNGLFISRQITIPLQLLSCTASSALSVLESMMLSCGYEINSSTDLKNLQRQLFSGHMTDKLTLFQQLGTHSRKIFTIGVLPIIISYLITYPTLYFLDIMGDEELESMAFATYVTATCLVFMSL